MGAGCGVCRSSRENSDVYIDEKKVPLDPDDGNEDDNNNTRYILIKLMNANYNEIRYIKIACGHTIINM